jgi:glyoxylase-like metal-dependent hydrolase (beta-lactamase superfamily II)
LEENHVQKVYEGNLVEIFSVTPDLYFRRADLRKRQQCNGAFLVGNGAVGIVDVPTVEAAQEMTDEAKKLFDMPIRYVFLTHGHDDHVSGMPFFMDKDVTVFCSRRLLEDLAPEGSKHKATFVGIDGTIQLSLAGLKVELYALQDSAHSPWDMFVMLPDEKAVCTGDAVVEFETLYFHNAEVKGWIRSLKRLSKLNYETILPGHGGIYPYSYMKETADFLETLYRASKRLFDQLSLDDIANITAEKVKTMAMDFIASNDEDALEISRKAGQHAQREVRMVMWYLIRGEIDK